MWACRVQARCRCGRAQWGEPPRSQRGRTAGGGGRHLVQHEHVRPRRALVQPVVRRHAAQRRGGDVPASAGLIVAVVPLFRLPVPLFRFSVPLSRLFVPLFRSPVPLFRLPVPLFRLPVPAAPLLRPPWSKVQAESNRPKRRRHATRRCCRRAVGPRSVCVRVRVCVSACAACKCA